MSSLGRAFSLFTGASMLGSLTQVAKGKLTAVVLGTEGIGILSQLTNLWSLFSVAASLGLYNGMVRHLAPAWQEEDRMEFRRHMSSNSLLLMASGLIIPLLGCIYSAELSNWIFDDDGNRANLVCLILIGIPVYVAGQIYRAILNASKSIDQLVRARIFADVLSAVVLLALIFPFGLKGAIIGYIGLHVLYLGCTAYFVWRVLGRDVAIPDPKLFSSQDIRKNVGYGVNGLIAVSVGILTTLIVARWIITEGNADDNGLFAMALKVATVYLGGLSAAAGGYYFPMLSSAKSDAEMHDRVSETLSMYMFVIPPIIVVLVAGGELMMRILFSAEFIPAAILLLCILPGDLFRITAETVAMPLLVKKYFIASTGSYIAWAGAYLILVAFLLPIMGILGVAIAYLISQVFNLLLKLVLVRRNLAYRLDAATRATILRGMALVFTIVLVVANSTSDLLNWSAVCLSLILWTMASWSNPDFQSIYFKLLIKFGRSAAK